MMNINDLFEFRDHEAFNTSEDGDYFFVAALKRISMCSCGYYSNEMLEDWYYNVFSKRILVDWFINGQDIESLTISLWVYFLNDMKAKADEELKAVDNINMTTFISNYAYSLDD